MHREKIGRITFLVATPKLFSGETRQLAASRREALLHANPFRKTDEAIGEAANDNR